MIMPVQSVHLVSPSNKSADVVVSAIGAVAELAGLTQVADPVGADLVICIERGQVAAELERGRRVLHVGLARGDVPLEALARRYPDQYTFTPAFRGEGALVPTLFRLATMGTDSKAVVADARREAEISGPPVISEDLSPSPIRGLRVMVVDDKDGNRASAQRQLGATNTVSVFGSYVDLLTAIQSQEPAPDLILSDMIMPAEEFCLTSQALSKYMGSEFPAGIFVAMAAARRGVPRVIIQTDAGHHDHPALAMVDFMGWGEEFTINKTKVSVVQAETVNGIKDWGKGITETQRRVKEVVWLQDVSAEDVCNRAGVGTQKTSLQVAQEMVDSYAFNKETGVSTFTVPAGVTDVEAMKALNEYFRKNHSKFDRDAVYAEDLDWYENLPKQHPTHIRDYSEARQIWIKAVVKATRGKNRTTQGRVLADKSLAFSDPRDQALAAAIHACKHYGENLFENLLVRGSVPGIALTTNRYFGGVCWYDDDFDHFRVAASGSWYEIDS